jgi:hypothetical protein
MTGPSPTTSYDTNYDTTPLLGENDDGVNYRKDWSGREDLNLRPPGPELSQYKLQVLYLVSLRDQQTTISLAQLYRTSCLDGDSRAFTLGNSRESGIAKRHSNKLQEHGRKPMIPCDGSAEKFSTVLCLSLTSKSVV